MNKFPWGIIAGIFAMIWSLAFIGLVAVYVISSMMYAQSGGDDGLRDSAWLLPLYIGNIVSAVGCGIGLVMHRISSNQE